MSTHVLDASGQRALSLTVNDPSATRASMHAKAGDDVAVQIGGTREVVVGLPDNARIQRRQYVTRVHRREGGTYVKDENGDYVYDERTDERLVLVLGGGVQLFGRSSFRDGEEATGIELTPHTTYFVKRQPEPHFLESGELVEEFEVSELLAKTE